MIKRREDKKGRKGKIEIKIKALWREKATIRGDRAGGRTWKRLLRRSIIFF